MDAPDEPDSLLQRGVLCCTTSCLSAQPAHTALQSFNRRKCALLLRDSCRHSGPAASQCALLSATAAPDSHVVVRARKTLTSTSTMSTPSRQRLTFASKCIPHGILIRLHFSTSRPQGASPLPDRPSYGLSLLFSPGRQPHNAPLLHSARTVHEVVAEEYRILESVNYELETYTPGDWMKPFEVRFSLRTQQRCPQATPSLLARVPSGVLASGALCIVSDYVRDCSCSLDSRPSPIGSSAWFRLLQDGAHWGGSPTSLSAQIHEENIEPQDQETFNDTLLVTQNPKNVARCSPHHCTERSNGNPW